MSSQGDGKQEMAKQLSATPNGHQIYLTPTDPLREPKRAETASDVKRLHREYLERLRREAAIDRELAGLDLEEAGVSLTGHVKDESKSDRKVD
jgi:hypothetical protein